MTARLTTSTLSGLQSFAERIPLGRPFGVGPFRLGGSAIVWRIGEGSFVLNEMVDVLAIVWRIYVEAAGVDCMADLLRRRIGFGVFRRRFRRRFSASRAPMKKSLGFSTTIVSLYGREAQKSMLPAGNRNERS